MEHKIYDILKNINEIQQKLAGGIQNNDKQEHFNTLLDVLGKQSTQTQNSDLAENAGSNEWQTSAKHSLEYLIDLIENSDNTISNSASAILTQFGEQIIEYVSPTLFSDNINKRLFSVNIIGKIKSNSSLPLLAKLMETETEEIVLDAIYEAIGLLENKEAIPFLLKHLNKTKDLPWRQFPIVYALIKIADESIIEVMLQLIVDEVLNPLAIECLGKIGDPSVITPLFGLLEKIKGDFKKLLAILSALKKIEQNILDIQQYHKDETIFQFIIDKFSSLNNPEITKLILKNINSENLENQMTMLWALKRTKKSFDPETLFALISQSEDEKLTEEILEIFSASDEDLTEFFLEKLKKGSVYEQVFAMKHLMFNTDDKIINILRKKISNQNAKIKIQAAKTLGISFNPKAIEPLIKLLEDDNPEVMEAAVGAIAINGDSTLISKIRPLLKKGSDIVKKNIITILGIIDDPEFFLDVTECLNDSSHIVRAEAAKVIGIIGNHVNLAKFQFLPDKLKSLINDESIFVRKDIIKAISVLYHENAQTIDFLENLQNSEDLWTKYYAVSELAKYKKEGLLPIVLNNLKDELPIQVLSGYCQLIGEISDGTGLKELINLIDFPDPELQSIILKSIGTINNPGGLSIIIKKCSSRNLSIKTAAISALGCFSQKKVEDTLVNIIRDLADHLYLDEFNHFEKIVQAAIESFGKSESCRRIDVLIPFAKDDRFTTSIFRVLIAKKEAIFERINSFVKSKDPSIRRLIAIVLGEIKHTDSLQYLEKLLNDNYPSVRRATIMAIGKIGSAEGLRILKSVAINKLPELEKFLAQNSIDLIENNSSKIN